MIPLNKETEALNQYALNHGYTPIPTNEGEQQLFIRGGDIYRVGIQDVDGPDFVRVSTQQETEVINL